MINPKISTEIWEAVEQYTDTRGDFILIGDDFSTLTPSHRTYNYSIGDDYFSGTVVGMPPKGEEVLYFNAVAAFADCIIIIVPKTFKKISIQNRLDMGFVLKDELKVESFVERDKLVSKSYIAQVWVIGFREPIHPVTGDFSFVKYSRLGIRRVGALAGEIVENGEASTSFYYIEGHIPGLPEILNSIDWTVVSANTISVPSVSKPEIIWMYNKWKELYNS